MPNRSILVIADMILTFCSIGPASGDPIFVLTKGDAERIATLVQPGTILIRIDETPHGHPWTLEARKIVSIEPTTDEVLRTRFADMGKQFDHSLIITLDNTYHYVASAPYFVDDKNQRLTAPGNCIQVSNSDDDRLCDSSSCRVEVGGWAEQFYIAHDDTWKNLVSLVIEASPQYAAHLRTRKKTFQLDETTINNIARCTGTKAQ